MPGSSTNSPPSPSRTAVREVANHQQRPLAAHDLGGATDRTLIAGGHLSTQSSAMLYELKHVSTSVADQTCSAPRSSACGSWSMGSGDVRRRRGASGLPPGTAAS